uniref:Uncharacterized protein n=1 Tax=Arundo donax TaxID=35708 RepID=A0A0A8YNX6_ARUDO
MFISLYPQFPPRTWFSNAGRRSLPIPNTNHR